MPQAGEKAALDKDDQLIVNRSATLQRSVTKRRGGGHRGRGRVTRWTTTFCDVSPHPVLQLLVQACYRSSKSA